MGCEVSTQDQLKILWDLQPLNPVLPRAAEGIGHKVLLPILKVLTSVKLDELNLLYDLYTDSKTRNLVRLNFIAFAPDKLSALIFHQPIVRLTRKTSPTRHSQGFLGRTIHS